MDNNRLHKLLEELAAGIDDRDAGILAEELRQEENEQIREAVRNIGNITPEHLEPRMEKMWCEVERRSRTASTRRRRWKKITGYAAAITLLAAAGTALYFTSTDNNAGQLTAEIEPGRKQSVLVFDDGAQLRLRHNPELAETILESESMEIRLSQDGLVSYNTADDDADISYVTLKVSRAEEHSIILADGTTVYVNSDSELRFPTTFAGTERRVSLQGEAYFDVKKDDDKPFIVESGGLSVRVHGTQFNLNSYLPSAPFVTLVEGSVSVSDAAGGQMVMLSPGRQAMLTGGVLSVSEVDTAITTAWRRGLFHFDTAPLESIASQMERWYDIDFVFIDEGMRNHRFTGIIDRSYPANRILDIISKTTNTKFEIRERTVYVSR